MRKATNAYANYGKYFIAANKEEKTFRCGVAERGAFWEDVTVTLKKDDRLIVPTSLETEWKQPDFQNYTLLTLKYGGEIQADVRAEVCADGICFYLQAEDGVTAVFSGKAGIGRTEDCFSVCLNCKGQILRSAVGPATSVKDDAVFNRQEDCAVVFSQPPRLQYCRERNGYVTDLFANEFRVSVKERVYEDVFSVRYGAINKNNTFPVPPVGWMTWYAVRFDACEEAVLKNARWMKENLKDYGADTIWVDWEWYHSDFFNHEASEKIGYFTPDPERYPHGMKYVSDKIREMGLIPALWIGPTHEPAKTAFVEENQDSVLAKEMEWCGEYFFDLTDKKYRQQYLCEAVKKVKEWGYDALKWDCLPVTLLFADRYHEYMSEPEKTSEEALREVVRLGREIVGKDFYMLSCAGAADREIRFAIDCFDGARIGGDIFSWQEYIDSFVKRVLRFYPFHNVEVYCDPDNVVLREEYNTYDQAVSRASSVAVLGLPFTLGDDLTALPKDRVDIIKKCIPAVDAHPCDIRESALTTNFFTVNLSIAKSFEQWNIVDVMNLAETDQSVTIDFEDLGLEKGKYLVYEFWNDEFVGLKDDGFVAELRPCASKVFAVRKFTGIPQVVSTTRHITQGGVDLLDVRYDENRKALSGISHVVKGDRYKISAYDPYRGIIVKKEWIPEETGDVSWEIKF